ncbi:rossmann-like alpha/beta/alpha sandwich fold protein [Artemisia annua]|uniref:Rossmann-like alpha/beta/alpha sandwich fold protein n=1 Tax=Artemisia annua TaxID=35608 RepID=A0A2U1NUT6_ARTAN|nr:rossmann-like alpha/beta/alpha sandwich fold protein [Artemisia annua]
MADDKNIVSNDKAPPPINIINFDKEYENGISGDMFPYGNVSDVVYVVTWKGTEELLSASKDALLWTLGKRLLHESTMVYLIHVFPELRFIPTPQGKIPDSRKKQEKRIPPKVSFSLLFLKEEYENGISGDMFPYGNVSDVVYVVTWKGTEELLSASKDALLWTLGKRLLHESTMVYLIHVFPELRFIPTPLGRLPINQVNPEQKERYLIQERSKRSEYLQKFLSLCSSSKVQVETVLIESDMEAKAILDLIPILNIRKLVLGATKSSIRKLKSSSKRGSGGGTLDQIVHNAPQFCEVKVICEGKEVSLQDQLTSEPPSPSSTAPSQRDINVDSHKTMRAQQDKTIGFVNFSCFKL